MTYDEFKAFLMTHLWKVGDTVVENSLDTIIFTAETELNRVLKVEDRTETATFTFADNATDYTLPPEVRTIRALSIPRLGELIYVTPSDFANRSQHVNAKWNHFTVSNKTIRIVPSPSLPNPIVVNAQYYAQITHFKDAAPSMLAEEFFDLFLYCTLKHTAPFLREDARLNTWAGLYKDCLAGALAENDDKKYAGSPLSMKFSTGIR